ncbi:MAG: DUF493 domain-containing protein [Sulfurovum sp.]|nr:DUF493 domain-containing protein [Sulfurovum sp.]MCB4762333.1 DUF493 domain-containing protein [Sulfurovum sp.]MCB4775899.1 DUF493 domain-containing protein [Sulfurovum sp.]
MIFDNNTQDKPVITYPTNWRFKIIGRDKKKLEACIEEVMGGREHCNSLGNTSQTGKFTTYNTSCIVESKEERDRLFESFQSHKDVKMVI